MLTSLSLGHNGFRAIPNITKICDTLKMLQMVHNHLSDVSILYEAQFVRLIFLDLASNYIDSFIYPKFRWPRLRVLQLQHNHIKSITHEWFWNAIEPLTIVADNNSWHCSRDLCWLKNCNFGHSFDSTGYRCGSRIGSLLSLSWRMECTSPLEWKGRDVAGNTIIQWASCQIRKIAGAHAPGMPGTFSPSLQVSDPDMHHGTCVTHVP